MGTRLIQASFRMGDGGGRGGGGAGEALMKGRRMRGVLEESIRLPVAGPLPGGTAWLLPPAALSSRCRPGSDALTHNSSNTQHTTHNTQHTAVRAGKEKALQLSVPSLLCKIFQ